MWEITAVGAPHFLGGGAYEPLTSGLIINAQFLARITERYNMATRSKDPQKTPSPGELFPEAEELTNASSESEANFPVYDEEGNVLPEQAIVPLSDQPVSDIQEITPYLHVNTGRAPLLYKLLQSNQDDIDAGQFYCERTGQGADDLIIVPVSLDAGRVLFVGQAKVCSSDDGKNAVLTYGEWGDPLYPGRACAICPLNEKFTGPNAARVCKDNFKLTAIDLRRGRMINLYLKGLATYIVDTIGFEEVFRRQKVRLYSAQRTTKAGATYYRMLCDDPEPLSQEEESRISGLLACLPNDTSLDPED
jgi:hypothetical protein